MQIIPQIILLVCGLLLIGISIGQKVGVMVIAQIVAVVMLHALLYIGGWYDHILSLIGG